MIKLGQFAFAEWRELMKRKIKIKKKKIRIPLPKQREKVKESSKIYKRSKVKIIEE